MPLDTNLQNIRTLMKLTSIYWKYTIYTFLIVLIIGSITHYYIFRHSIHRSTDDVLNEYKQEILEYAALNDTIPSLKDIELKHSRLMFNEIDNNIDNNKEYAIYDSLIYSKYEKERVVYRVLKFNVNTGNNNYQVLLSQPTLEEDDLMSAVIMSLLILLLLFLISSALVSAYYTRILWQPFYHLLIQLRRFRIERSKPSKIKECGIDEFDEMGSTVSEMMNKIHNDYNSLKELIENTSHEMQTPLSIIKMKLDMLQQHDIGDEKSLGIIRDMQRTVSHMTRFNRALLLIARINNDQFGTVEKILLNEYADEYLGTYEDLLQDRSIEVRKYYNRPFIMEMNRILAERLVMNLIVNAVRYTCEGGYIEVETSDDMIKISNPYHHKIPAGDLFARFNRTSSHEDSTGLGLTIVKNICQKSGLKVEASFNETIFSIIISKTR